VVGNWEECTKWKDRNHVVDRLEKYVKRKGTMRIGGGRQRKGRNETVGKWEECTYKVDGKQSGWWDMGRIFKVEGNHLGGRWDKVL
jgi:hypothetical protein